MGFNSVGLALATFGFLNPIFAAFLHHVSSVFVVTNAGRLYFTHIENSFAQPLFRKMDAWSTRKINQPDDPEKEFDKESGGVLNN
jgi:Cu+-exporting ATPase